MQTQRSNNGDAQNADVLIRELETESVKAFIEEIWRRFTEEPFELQRRLGGYQIEASTHP